VNCNDQTWCAESALNSACFDEGLLDIRERISIGETFDRGDFGRRAGCCHDEAGADRVPIEEDGARAAFALFTCTLGPWKPKTLAQDVQQGLADP
jgi:hypothetical protein